MRRQRIRVQRLGVRILDHTPALELLVDADGVVSGARALDCTTGEVVRVEAGAVVLAAGGCAFQSKTLGCDVNTGDGALLAVEAGAQLSGTEFSNAYAIAPKGTSLTKTAYYSWATAGLSPEHATLFAHANVWPPQEPRLRAATHRYHDAFVDVARRVLGLYARVLDVPAHTFPLGADVYTTLVVNDYPKWPHDAGTSDAEKDEEKLLLLEHADSSAITVLHQEGDYAGLQGQRPDGTWIPVPIRPGALQVFTGTLLTNWTEGRLRPGRHRVVADGSVTRRSSAVFVHPSLDTVVEPLPAFADPDDSDFEPVPVWERAGSNVDEYLRVFGRPEQVAAWRENRAYVAEVTA